MVGEVSVLWWVKISVCSVSVICSVVLMWICLRGAKSDKL